MTHSTARSMFPWLVVVGVLVAALSLRNPIAAPTPVLRDIADDLQVDSAAAGLLTSAPVLMFAVLTPVAAVLIRRVGAEIALMSALVGVLIGTVIRSMPGYGWLLAGMIVIGMSITIGNVVVPVLIRRDVPPERVALVTALYTVTLNVGSLITSLGTAPLAELIGWSWALLSWSLLTILGVAVWGRQVRVSRRSDDADRFSGSSPTPAPTGTTGVADVAMTGPLPVMSRGVRLVRPITIMLMITFGLATGSYYALTTWLPTFAADELGLDRTASGALASIYQGAAIGGALLMPLLGRFFRPIVPAVVVGASWIILTFGMLLAPELLALWLTIGSVGHAGGFVVVFSMLVGAARSDAEAASMSALVQGGGYAIGALGAPGLAVLHEASNGWSLPILTLAITSVVYTACLIGCVAVVRRSSARP